MTQTSLLYCRYPVLTVSGASGGRTYKLSGLKSFLESIPGQVFFIIFLSNQFLKDFFKI